MTNHNNQNQIDITVKIWSKPELKVISIAKDTLGGSATGSETIPGGTNTATS